MWRVMEILKERCGGLKREGTEDRDSIGRRGAKTKAIRGVLYGSPYF